MTLQVARGLPKGDAAAARKVMLGLSNGDAKGGAGAAERRRCGWQVMLGLSKGER